jgi:hypothetical protein
MPAALSPAKSRSEPLPFLSLRETLITHSLHL